MKGDLPKAGASAMAMLSATTLLERIDRLRLPTVTCRPSALVSSDSIFGRKLFAFISKGSAIRITKKIATATAPILRIRFMSLVPASLQLETDGLERESLFRGRSV